MHLCASAESFDCLPTLVLPVDLKVIRQFDSSPLQLQAQLITACTKEAHSYLTDRKLPVHRNLCDSQQGSTPQQIQKGPSLSFHPLATVGKLPHPCRKFVGKYTHLGYQGELTSIYATVDPAGAQSWLQFHLNCSKRTALPMQETAVSTHVWNTVGRLANLCSTAPLTIVRKLYHLFRDLSENTKPYGPMRQASELRFLPIFPTQLWQPL